MVEGNEEVASGEVGLKGESLQEVKNPTQEKFLNEEKEIWRRRLREAFCVRINRKKHLQSTRQYWFNTKEKFNGL